MRTTTSRTRRATVTAGLAAALVATTLAATTPAGAARPTPLPGALPSALAPADRADLLADAARDAARTAGEIGLGGKERLLVRDVVRDADGSLHTRYERSYAGLPVLGGDLVVHETSGGDVEEVTRSTEARIALASTTARLSADSAEREAVDMARKDDTAKASGTARKVVWAATGTPVLAYETVVGGVQEDGAPNELHVITEATSGAVLFEYQGVKSAEGHSHYSGTVEVNSVQEGSGHSLTDQPRGNHQTFDLNHSGSGMGGTLLTDEDDVWGSGSASDVQTAGVDVAYGAAETWDYFKEVHGRMGIRGDGVGSASKVHYYTNYRNAHWADECFCMLYGDGANGEHPLTTLDTVAHEMSHGVTSVTANLFYVGESGGLNEATSDIFAAAVEAHAKNPEDPADYLVGEKFDYYGNGKPLRYMDKPSKDGASKDYWYSGIGSSDVHYSSGVANHFFYLLAEGSGQKVINGVSYDSPTYDNLPVTGIGQSSAEKIWFRALTTYMTSTTNFAGARQATLEAASDLYGADSVEYRTVDAAWAGVNVH